MCRPTKRPKPLPDARLDVFKPDLSVGETGVELRGEACGAEDMNLFGAGISLLLPEDASLEKTTEDKSVLTPLVPSVDKPKTFIFVCYKILTNPKYAHAIRFTTRGNGVEVLDPSYLGECILPYYFRHRNVASFYRQLNSYGFRTARSTPGVSHTFVHEQFHRDHPERLSGILRKKCMLALQQQQQQQQQAVLEQHISANQEESKVKEEKHAVESTPKQHERLAWLVREMRALEQRQEQQTKQLEENNALLRQDNHLLVQEEENCFDQGRQLVENQVDILRQLFGPEASDAFEKQARSELETMARFVKSSCPSVGAQSALLDLPGDDELVLPDQDLLDLETLICLE